MKAMEFNKKLQELRKKKGITQEELAEKLYVSRTAVSKWESGRGYPNIESLKAIAAFFSVTVDELLSTDEVIVIAENDKNKKENKFKDLTFGLLDLFMSLVLFLPLFAVRGENVIYNMSLILLDGVQPYVKVIGIAVVVTIVITGILIIALQSCESRAWGRIKTILSLSLSVVAVLFFIMSLQPYAAVFAFVLLAIKAFMLIKFR